MVVNFVAFVSWLSSESLNTQLVQGWTWLTLYVVVVELCFMYTRGASSVRCSCCQTLNLVPAPTPSNQFAHINCGNCRTTLMYPYGASSVKCAVYQFVTNVNLMGNGRVPNMPNGAASPGTMLSTSTQSIPPSKTQTVVVENPMSVNGSGKLVSFRISCVLV
ncbi:hypothetical protein Bca4012_007426 [Brassica carinata]